MSEQKLTRKNFLNVAGVGSLGLMVGCGDDGDSGTGETGTATDVSSTTPTTMTTQGTSMTATTDTTMTATTPTTEPMTSSTTLADTGSSSSSGDTGSSSSSGSTSTGQVEVDCTQDAMVVILTNHEDVHRMMVTAVEIEAEQMVVYDIQGDHPLHGHDVTLMPSHFQELKMGLQVEVQSDDGGAGHSHTVQVMCPEV